MRMERGRKSTNRMPGKEDNRVRLDGFQLLFIYKSIFTAEKIAKGVCSRIGLQRNMDRWE